MEQIPWYESAIIRQQVVQLVIAVVTIVGVKTSIDWNSTITAIFAGIAAVVAVVTILTRLFKPHPPLTNTAAVKEIATQAALVQKADANVPPSNQAGFARVSMLLTVVGLGIVGCSLVQKQAVTKNFNQLLSDAVAIDDGIVVLGTSMLNSGAITSSQAKQVLAVTDKIKGVLDAARDAYAAGNVILANSQLSVAMGDLATAQSCTGATNPKVTLDSCLAPIGGAP